MTALQANTTARRVLPWLALALGTGMLTWGGWTVLRSRPTLDGEAALARAGALDAAEQRVRAYLDDYPDSSAAHLLLAQVILQRLTRPGGPAGGSAPAAVSAQVALEHLAQVDPTDPQMAGALALNRGKAQYLLKRLVDAEASWLKALQLDPHAGEAGWGLLELYYRQGRAADARRLALRLSEATSNPRDRVLLLLEPVRHDARSPAPASLVKWLEPAVRQDPADLHSAVALGMALVHDAQVDAGVAVLRLAVRRHPDDPDAWSGLLAGLDAALQVDALEQALGGLPAALAGSPRFAKYRGRVAQERRDWPEAIRAYRRARAAEPYDRTLEYRLSRALRHAGETAEADRIEHQVRRHDLAFDEAIQLSDLARKLPTLGVQPHPDLYQQLADVHDRMQLRDEARAWHRLASRPSRGEPGVSTPGSD
jgi:predicted Zn-dependent protease